MQQQQKGCLGIWSDEHVSRFAPIVQFAHKQGAKIGIQIAHAGRKASVSLRWQGQAPLSQEKGGWETVAPSALKFHPDAPTVPRALNEQEIEQVVQQFVSAAKRAVAAGFDLIEIHAGHGYLLHEFYSPFSNTRNDKYGGSLENRVRLVKTVAEEVRNVIPDEMPLMMRVSCRDWVDGAWSLDDSVELAKILKQVGVDLIDCSAGGNVFGEVVPLAPGYMAPFAQQIKHSANIATAAVGLITTAQLANEIIESGKADLVMMGRHLLYKPYFPLEAMIELGVDKKLVNEQWPNPYAWPQKQ